MRNTLFGMALLLFTFACADQQQEKLVGNWQAFEVLEKGRPMDINAGDIRFSFGAEDRYRFEGTLNYREAGTYYLQSKYLYTIDTVNQASTEKAVEIIKLTDDSLFLKMHETGKERIMKLVKVR